MPFLHPVEHEQHQQDLSRSSDTIRPGKTPTRGCERKNIRAADQLLAAYPLHLSGGKINKHETHSVGAATGKPTQLGLKSFEYVAHLSDAKLLRLGVRETAAHARRSKTCSSSGTSVRLAFFFSFFPIFAARSLSMSRITRIRYTCSARRACNVTKSHLAPLGAACIESLIVGESTSWGGPHKGSHTSGPVFKSLSYEVSSLEYRICIRIARLCFFGYSRPKPPVDEGSQRRVSRHYIVVLFLVLLDPRDHLAVDELYRLLHTVGFGLDSSSRTS